MSTIHSPYAPGEPFTPNSRRTCAEVVERLPWWLNGTLAEEEDAFVVDHLQSCASCCQELEETDLVAETFSRALAAENVVDFADARRARESVEPRPSVFRKAFGSQLAGKPSSRRLALAASLVGAICLGFLFGRGEIPDANLVEPVAGFGAEPTAALELAHEPWTVGEALFTSGFEGSPEEDWSLIVGLDEPQAGTLPPRSTNPETRNGRSHSIPESSSAKNQRHGGLT